MIETPPCETSPSEAPRPVTADDIYDALLNSPSDVHDWNSWDPKHIPAAIAIGWLKVETPTLPDVPDIDNAADWTRKHLGSRATEALEIQHSLVFGIRDCLKKLGVFYRDLRAPKLNADSILFLANDNPAPVRLGSEEFQIHLRLRLKIGSTHSAWRFIRDGLPDAILDDTDTREIIPESFWAVRPGKIYLSCGADRLVRISSEAVEVLPNGADGVLIAPGCSLKPWDVVTESRDPFENCSLFRRLRETDPHTAAILRNYLAALPQMPAARPHLCLVAEGAAPQFEIASAIADLFGLPPTPIILAQSAQQHFLSWLDRGGFLSLHNINIKPKPWLHPYLIAAATGRRIAGLDPLPPAARSSASLLLTASDADIPARLAPHVLLLPVSEPTRPTAASVITAEIAENRNAFLSYIAHAIRQTLARRAEAAPTPMIRESGQAGCHPDFFNLIRELSQSVGNAQETQAAIEYLESESPRARLNQSALGNALLTLIAQEGGFEGKAGDLAVKLRQIDPTLKKPSSVALGRWLSDSWHTLAAMTSVDRWTESNTSHYRLGAPTKSKPVPEPTPSSIPASSTQSTASIKPTSSTPSPEPPPLSASTPSLLFPSPSVFPLNSLPYNEFGRYPGDPAAPSPVDSKPASYTQPANLNP